VAVLIAFALVVAAGLVTAVLVASTSANGASAPERWLRASHRRNYVGWPVAAFALLGVAGVSWWQINRWNELSREDLRNHEARSTA
jgi:hypothetical protein